MKRIAMYLVILLLIINIDLHKCETEKILNGTFDTNLDNWHGGANWVWDNGRALASSSGQLSMMKDGDGWNPNLMIEIDSSKTYTLSFDWTYADGEPIIWGCEGVCNYGSIDIYLTPGGNSDNVMWFRIESCDQGGSECGCFVRVVDGSARTLINYKSIEDPRALDGMTIEQMVELMKTECDMCGNETYPVIEYEDITNFGIQFNYAGIAQTSVIDNVSLMETVGIEPENAVPTKPVIVDIGGVEANNSTVDDLTPRGNGTASTDEDEDTLYYAWYTIETGGDFGTPDFNTTFSETVDVASLGELTNATEYDTILVVTDLTDTNQSDVFNFTAQVLEEEPEPSCGDEECNGTETCETCEADCGECEPEPSCGDEECNGTETCETCEADCGVCVEDDDDDDDGGTGGSGSSGTSTGYTVTPKDIPGEVGIEEDFDIIYEIKTDSNKPIQVSTTVVVLDENNREVFSESKSSSITEEGTVNISVEGLSEGEYTLKIISKGKTLYTKTITSKDLATIEKESENKELLYIAIIGLLGLFLFIVYILRNKIKKLIRGKKKNGKQKTKNKSM